MVKEKTNNKLFISGKVLSKSFKEQAYLLIKDAILYRRIEEGIIYSQDRICSELEISRTPVREALLELQKEGYVKFLRGRGIVITPITKEELQEVLEMRYYVEVIGTRLSAERIDDVHKMRLRMCYEEQMRESNNTEIDRIKLYRIDRKLHSLIFKASKNRWLLDTVENLRDRYMRIDSQIAFESREYINAVLSEHGDILHALMDGDAKAAESAMKRHLQQSYTRNVSLPFDGFFANE